MIQKIGVTALKGFCMGAADIVPGVSGGTVALVFGIYEQLLRNVRVGAKALGAFAKFDFTQGKTRLFSIEWSFILPLAAGLVFAVKLLSSWIESLLETRPEEMAGLFFGLVVASMVIAWQMLTDRGAIKLAVIAGVGVVAFFLLGLQSGLQNDPPLLAYFGAGALAVCATILPGISGSFILLMLGMYAAVLKDVHDYDFVSLGVLLLGMIIGLSFFSTGLGWLLDHHYNYVLAALIGLMLGSLRVLWPWPHGVGVLNEEGTESLSGTGIELPTSDNFLLPVLLAVGSCLFILAINSFAQRLQSKNLEHQKPV